MRINLYLTPSNPLPKLSSSAGSVPKPLLALSPDGELVLIELQGSLEMELAAMGEGGIGRQTIGELMWGDGKEDKPTLNLSHHRLEGKLTNLTKPLAVLEKRKRILADDPATLEAEADLEDVMDQEEDGKTPKAAAARSTGGLGSTSRIGRTTAPTEPPSSPLGDGLGMMGDGSAVRALLGDSDEEDEETDRNGAPGSPSIRRKMGNKDSDRPLGPKRARQEVTTSTSGANTALRSSPAPPSSSPAPLPPMRGSALDFSSPPATPLAVRQRNGSNKVKDDGAPTTHAAEIEATPTNGGLITQRKRPTATHYDVVCLIRRKVLFSKRPEPVVHRS